MKIDRDTVVQICTLAAVILGGGGNAVLTEKTSIDRQHDVDRAITEVHELHGAINEALERQKRIESKLDRLEPK